MTQPPLTIPSAIEVQRAERLTLANGVTLHLLPTDDFEVLRVTFVFRAGSAVQRVPFSASTTANLLAEGTRNHTAHEIAEQLDFYGSWFDVNLDRDFVYISFATLSKFCRPTLGVAEEILLHPTFPEEELRTYCAKRRQRLRIDRQKVDVKAREAFAEALFGPQHPYGISFDEALYDQLTRADVENFYRMHYTAENCFVVCSGRIDDEVRETVAAIAGSCPTARCTFRNFRRRLPGPKPASPTPGPCSRRSASGGCFSTAAIPILSGCRWWRPSWAAISDRV